MDHLWKKFNFLGDAFDIVQIFKDEPHLFFLDSHQYDSDRSRYSFIGFDPFTVVQHNGKNSLATLKKEFLHFSNSKNQGIVPFPSGIVGYLAYDYGLYQENISLLPKGRSGLPDCFFGFYDSVIVVDHYAQQLYACSSGLPEKNFSLRHLRAQERLDAMIRKLDVGFQGYLNDQSLETPLALPISAVNLKSNFSKADYLKAVAKAKDYIHRGDIYQVNLSQRFESPLTDEVDSLKIYQTLRQLAPASFNAYFDAKDFKILSSSPERFLRLHNGIVQTRPMKGTRPRSLDPTQDRRLKEEIIHSQKDKAELLMITDLERNDLGKVCDYGSIIVDEMRAIEEYPYVFQATSNIRGNLRRDHDGFDVLKACFPGGSITGCPKIRAMEIIEELEPTRRGIYTGCLGYMSFSGQMDFNILIRTLIASRDKISYQVGGGIVADSVPENEYNETLVKASAIERCLQQTFSRFKNDKNFSRSQADRC